MELAGLAETPVEAIWQQELADLRDHLLSIDSDALLA
jgi:hypothetical protein